VVSATCKELYHDEGEIEVDDGAPVSIGEDAGAYVQAWVWVYSERTTAPTMRVSPSKQKRHRNALKYFQTRISLGSLLPGTLTTFAALTPHNRPSTEDLRWVRS